VSSGPPAGSTSWKHLPPPSRREDLAFRAEFTHAEAERVMQGLVPERMEDKWFIYFEDGWLRFHRSWTGAFIYALRLEESSAGARVAESWVNRDPDQYRGSDTEYDRRLVRFLIDAFLLGKAVSFPLPAGADTLPEGLTQHSLVGRGYPESPYARRPKKDDASS
jgi:hypothetical protein